ncbi:MAG: NAD-dependent epimerase/dehydratase family protein, partial [Gammaproteobacteria bacterium]
MNKVLVTGGGDILDYHVIKRLNERGIRPRSLVLPGSDTTYIKRLSVDPMGEITASGDLAAAVQGMDTVVHMAYEVKPGGTLEDMHEVNVVGTRKLLDAAQAAGVTRVVATSSALTVGVHRDPAPLDEDAEWAVHKIDLPYAESRREAEQLALSRSRPGFEVVVVAPALTIGPEDFGPAPGGSLIKRVVAGRFVPTVDVGVGCVDVRDFADGVLLAAERGRPGQRYVLCAHNPTLKDLVAEVAAIAGTRARTWHLPRWLPRVLVAALVFWSRIRRKTPPVPPAIAKLIGRYGWYDARRMRDDLGWRPRPLHETLADTVRWFRE